MGVHGLWELLAPVGCRVSVETLAGKKLAIGIWMVQFMKAMRDEKGEMIRNAHILGFFRRICKLLFLRTKPVFVFDGGTPALKRRTVIARRRQRENAQSKIRKTAEKLLLNHLMRVKEIALDLEKQRRDNDAKGKKVMREERETDIGKNVEKGNDEVETSFNQQELDELLAASLAAEENEGFRGDNASTSGAGVAQDEVWGDDDEDGDEEMILPEMQGNIDPAILASLPPSMQLDLLVQMRERLMAENRQKYQKVKKAPARFSELQIQSYLKTVAFRREIDGVQKAAAGRGIDGVQISRIASESNREFIFSSSFTGDKEAFISVGQEKIDASQSQSTPGSSTISSTNKVTPTKRSATATPTKRALATPTKRATEAETEKAFNDDVETYLDERGRVRVSRLKAMGMTMTRDLQSNLELMKKIEQEREDTGQEILKRTTARNLADVSVKSSERIDHHEIAETDNAGLRGETDKFEDSALIKETPIEISFEDICDIGSVNEDDHLFATLVAGDPVIDFSNDNDVTKQTLLSTSDCEWEEGVIEVKSKLDLIEGAVSDGDEVDWEDGQLNFTSIQDEKKEYDEDDIEWEEDNQEAYSNSMSYPDENRETASKGAQEEEAEFQEAIRRSLKDSMVHKSPKDDEPGLSRDIEMSSVFAAEKSLELETPVTQASGSEQISDACIEVNLDKNNLDQMNLVGRSSGNFNSNDLAGKESFTDLQPEMLLVSDPSHPEHVFQAAVDDLSFETGEVGNANDSVTKLDDLTLRMDEVGKTSVSDSATEVDESLKKTNSDIAIESQGPTSEPYLVDVDEKNEDMGGYLEEEMVFLANEREELGNEQRKLERNAESVSSEMFVECQELLHMFGLPYIIAPMEAEAQCAFMELSNLVDGVVTDDSDAFLFGARTVYKNIFDDRKYVETYLMKDMENELGLNREKLIDMALLLGSDYTEGVSGIGIVNAIEVVNAFPEKNGLQEFREWIESPDPTILGNVGNSKSKVSKAGESSNSSQPEDELTRRKQIFMNKHRNVSKNWHIPSTFPSDAVISAYASPQVDKSTESFSWGKPDLSVLRKLCWDKFNWGTSKADDLLLPVLKEYNKHETQLRLEAFYTFNERFAKIRSKRIKKAVKGIAGDKSSQLMDETMPHQPGSSRKKRKVTPSENEADRSETSNQTSNLVKPTPKKLKGKQTKENTPHSHLEKYSTTSTTPKTHQVLRGRGLKARGKGQVRGKGREKSNISSEDDSETSHERDENLQFGGVSEPHQIRRSGRVRKTVTYNEFDDLDVETESRVNKGVKANESEGEAVNIDQTDRNMLNEGMDIELENDPFIGETEVTYDAGKMDTSQTDDNPIEDPLDQNELPKEDYLYSGGGFCVVDDEQNETADHASLVLEESIPEDPGKSISHSRPVITPMVKESVITPIVDEKDQIDDQIENGSRIAPERSLRAMPNLRRKKRKQT